MISIVGRAWPCVATRWYWRCCHAWPHYSTRVNRLHCRCRVYPRVCVCVGAPWLQMRSWHRVAGSGPSG